MSHTQKEYFYSVYPRQTCILAALFALLFFSGCSKQSQPIQLSASIESVIPDNPDADTIGDLDWFMITSPDLKTAVITPFDRRNGANFIESVTANINGKVDLLYAGVAQYKWSHGTVYKQQKEISPGLTMLVDEGAKGEFIAKIKIPNNATEIIIHGSASDGKPVIDAEIDGNKTRTEILVGQGSSVSWAYRLSILNAKGKTANISLRTTIVPVFTSSLTVSGLFVANQSSKNPEKTAR